MYVSGSWSCSLTLQHAQSDRSLGESPLLFFLLRLPERRPLFNFGHIIVLEIGLLDPSLCHLDTKPQIPHNVSSFILGKTTIGSVTVPNNWSPQWLTSDEAGLGALQVSGGEESSFFR